MLTWIDWLMILGYFGVLTGVVVFSLRRNKIESGVFLFLVPGMIADYAYFWNWLD